MAYREFKINGKIYLSYLYYWCAMIKFNKTETQIRILGLFLSGILFLDGIVSLFYTSKSLGSSGFLDFLIPEIGIHGISLNYFLIFLVSVLFAAYVFVFYLVTDEERLFSPNKKSIFMLIFLVLSGFSTCAQIPYVIDVLAGFILPVRYALIWIPSVLAIEMMIYATTPNSILDKLLLLFVAPQDLQIIFLSIIFLAIHCFTYFLGVLLSKEMRQKQVLDKLNAELKATQNLYEQNVRIEERLYIARELHDSIGHSLTAISTNLQLADKLTDNDAKEPITDAYNVSKYLLKEVRNIVSSLRSDDTIDLQEALFTLISAINYPKIELKIRESLKIKHPQISHTIFRCVQEIITNSVKHSRAKNLKIVISQIDNKIILYAKDNGIGVDKINLSNGLLGMQERVAQVEGTIDFYSELNKGFETKVIIPFEKVIYD